MDRIKILALILSIFLVVFLTHYLYLSMKMETVYTHFYYIPILISTICYKKKGLIIPIFFSFYLFFYRFIYNDFNYLYSDIIRISMFLFVGGIVCYLTDRLKKIEESLNVSENEFRNLFEHLPCGAAIFKAVDNGNCFEFLNMNQYGMMMDQVALDQIIGKKITDIYPQVKNTKFAHIMKKVFLTGIPEKHDNFIYNDDKLVVWRSNLIYRLPNKNITCIYTDETKKIDYEEKLIKNEALLKNIFNSIQAGISVFDKSGNIIRENSWYDKYSKNIQTNLKKICHNIANGNNTTKTDRIEISDNNNNTIFRMESFPLLDEHAQLCGIVVYTRDLTKKMRTERERLLLATVIDQMTESVIVTDQNRKILYVNPAFLNRTGYELSEILGETPDLFLADKHDPMFYDRIWPGVDNLDKIWSDTITNKTKNGREIIERVTVTPVFDQSEKTTNFVFIQRDRTEEIKKEKILRQSQKMEAIGTLAGGLAHDFNNILSPIIGYSEMARQNIQNQENTVRYLDEIYKAAFRAKELVNQILTFSRSSDQALRPIRMKYVVKEALMFLKAAIPSTISIYEDFSKNCGYVEADPTQIHQIIMNLFTNSFHAMQDTGGKITLRLTEKIIEAGDPINLVPGKYNCLIIEDTGKGIAPCDKDHIFDPFFTTKPKDVGTGLGLSVVHGIVKSYNGEIQVYSEPGKGSVFKIYIPQVELNSTGQAVFEPAKIAGGQERILLVDDDVTILKMEKEMLERLGYTIAIFGNSKAGLNAFKSDPGAYDVVITDYTMPDMTGYALAKEILRIKPEIPIILCTGFSEKINEDKAKAIGIKSFVMKPILQSDIAKAIREVMNAKQ